MHFVVALMSCTRKNDLVEQRTKFADRISLSLAHTRADVFECVTTVAEDASCFRKDSLLTQDHCFQMLCLQEVTP